MANTVWARQKAQPLVMVILLLSVAIAPLVSAQRVLGRESHEIKACENENLLLPSHPDLRSLEALYQKYLGYIPPTLDLGVTDLDLARLMMRFAEAVKAEDSTVKPLSTIDQSQLNALMARYRSAIAAIQSQTPHEHDQRHVKGQGIARFGGATGSTPLSPPAASPAPVVQGFSGRFSGNRSAGPLSESSRRPLPPVTGVERPPNFNTEEYARISDNPFFLPTQTPLSTFSVDVDTASYSNVRRFIKRGQLPPKDAVRLEEMINYFDYDYEEPDADQPFSINTEIAQAPWNPQHQLVQIGLKGQELHTRQPSNLVFLVDVSGSMRSPNKLPLLQRSLCLLVREMTPEDRVTLVTYAGSAGLVLPPTSGREKMKILKAIANLQAGGTTAGAAGINLAYDLAQKNFLPQGNNRVILATDGDFNVGISSNAELERLIERKREQGVYLSVLGFGTGNYKDSKMETLANKGNGNYAYLDTLAEARKVLVEDLTSTLFTIAKDVKIQVEFNPATVQAYRLIGYENRLLRAQDFNDDRKDAGEIGAGHTVTALYEIIPSGVAADFDLPDLDELRYQKSPDPTSAPINTDELMQVKLRYKLPTESASKLITRTIANPGTVRSALSKNLQLASAIAMFGMILRDSEFKGSSTLEKVSKTLQSRGTLNSYESELLALVKRSQSMQDRVQ